MLNNIAEKIISSRKEAKLSQTNLANYLKVSLTTVNRWEKGHIKKVSLSMIEKIAAATGKTIEYFLPESQTTKESPKGKILGNGKLSWIKGHFDCPHCKKEILIDVNKEGQIMASGSVSVKVETSGECA